MKPELSPTKPAVFRGEGLAEGVAIGTVVLHDPRVKVERMIAEDQLLNSSGWTGRLRVCSGQSMKCWNQTNSSLSA